MERQSYGEVLRYHAQRKPTAELAIEYPDGALTWWELERRSNQRANLLRSVGVEPGDLVTVALPNGISFHETTFAIWKCGAIPNVVSSRLPAHEFRAIIELARPRAVVGGDVDVRSAGVTQLRGDMDLSGFEEDFEPLPPHQYWKAMTSGGSTGRPKLIIDHAPASVDLDKPEFQDSVQMAKGMVVLNPGPMYHNGPFIFSHFALFIGCPVVGMARFDAEEALRLIERHRVNWVTFVPTMMHRIWSLPTEVRDSYDTSSLQAVWHMAAPCPPWLKQAWIEWLGAEKIWELYGGTERIGGTVVRGDEWVKNRGTVGRPVVAGAIRVMRDDGTECAPNEIGELYFRVPDPPPYHYIGAEARTVTGGWQSLGDMGSFDADGYLTLADRRTDMILRGGANIYPAEVEAALDAFPLIGSSVVVGLPCDELGQRVHAIIQPKPGAEIDVEEVNTFVRTRLASYKVPETYELASQPLRDDAGKVRRSALREQRVTWLREGAEFRTRIGRETSQVVSGE
jgi:bile acid-coenzyme A ligase